MPKQDILLDEDYNYKVINGDFAVGDSDTQNVDLLLNSDKGHIREFLTNGIGLTRYVSAETEYPGLRNIVSTELIDDGYNLTLFYYDTTQKNTIIDFN